MTDAETQRTIADIDHLGTLRPDWNGYGSPRIKIANIITARQFIGRFADLIDSPPEVVPMTDGRLQLEWVAGGRELEIEFSTSLTVHYLKWSEIPGPEGIREPEGFYPVDDHERSRYLFDWLFGRLEHDE